MAAFDMSDPKAVVSPGGVGFDINCGVRLLRTNLHKTDVLPLKEQLAQCLFDHIPVGVGSRGIIPMNAQLVYISSVLIFLIYFVVVSYVLWVCFVVCLFSGEVVHDFKHS